MIEPISEMFHDVWSIECTEYDFVSEIMTFNENENKFT